MTVTNYVVPHRGFGQTRRLAVDAVSPETFLQLMSVTEDDLLPITLCGHSSSGFRVRHEGDIVGVIPASQSAGYTELDSIISAGLTPQATAEIALREDAAGETTPVFEVLLPEPGLCVPLNIPPAQRWGMLNGDRALCITEFSSTARSLPKHSAQLLVHLKNTRNFFRRAVEVRLDDELIATIPRDQATQLSDTIAGFKHEGLMAIARAYFAPDAASPTLTVYTEEGTPDTNFAVGTAGVIAAAVGAVAATLANTDKAHAAIAPAGGFQTTSTAQGSGSTATQGAQALSLNSAGAAATAGTNIAVASTGLKIACAASAAVLVGGTASFISSVHAQDPAQDDVTDSVLEGYTTSLSASRPAADTKTDGEPSVWAEGAEDTTTGISLPEKQNLAATPRALEHTAFSATAEPTELSEPAEPTELTEKPEPTKLAEPTQHPELAAPEEVTPSTHTSTPSSTPAPPTTPPTREPYQPQPSATLTSEAPTSATTPPETTAPKTSAQPAPSTATTAPSTTTPSTPTTTRATTPHTSALAPSTTAEPSETPTSEPTPEPTPERTPEPSETPKPQPSTERTPEPSETPKPQPSTERTPEPSRTPDPTPEPTPAPPRDSDDWVIIIEFD